MGTRHGGKGECFITRTVYIPHKSEFHTGGHQLRERTLIAFGVRH
jgi:hypothetical protein